MNLLTNYPRIRRIAAAIPEAWFITFFVLLTYSNLYSLGSGYWHTGNTVTTSICILVVVLLVLQIIWKNRWSNLLFGLLFACGAGMLFCYVLSRYPNYPIDPELVVLKLISGISMATVSFLFACTMLIRGIRKIYS